MFPWDELTKTLTVFHGQYKVSYFMVSMKSRTELLESIWTDLGHLKAAPCFQNLYLARIFRFELLCSMLSFDTRLYCSLATLGDDQKTLKEIMQLICNKHLVDLK